MLSEIVFPLLVVVPDLNNLLDVLLSLWLRFVLWKRRHPLYLTCGGSWGFRSFCGWHFPHRLGPHLGCLFLMLSWPALPAAFVLFLPFWRAALIASSKTLTGRAYLKRKKILSFNSQKCKIHGIKIFIKIPFFVSEVFVDLTGPSLKLEEGIFIWSAVADKLTS